MSQVEPFNSARAANNPSQRTNPPAKYPKPRFKGHFRGASGNFVKEGTLKAVFFQCFFLCLTGVTSAAHPLNRLLHIMRPSKKRIISESLANPKLLQGVCRKNGQVKPWQKKSPWHIGESMRKWLRKTLKNVPMFSHNYWKSLTLHLRTRNSPWFLLARLLLPLLSFLHQPKKCPSKL